MMKKLLLALSLVLASLSMTTTTHANWFGGNNGQWKQGPYGPYWDESTWPEWTPMYWMEEFMDSWGNNSWGGNNWGNNYGGGYGFAPYNINPYGYGMPYGYVYPQPPIRQHLLLHNKL